MKRNIIAWVGCLSCLSIVLGVSITAHGQIYKWVDAEGRVHYSDTPVKEAEDVAEELPPAAKFISPDRPPATPAEEEPAQEQDGDPANSPQTQSDTEAAEAPTNGESSAAGGQEEEVIGMGEDGPFGPDGPDGRVEQQE